MPLKVKQELIPPAYTYCRKPMALEAIGMYAGVAILFRSKGAVISVESPPMPGSRDVTRRIRMEYTPRPVSQVALILFPLAITIIIGLLVPAALPLISMLMLGNLLRESGVVERLNKSAQNEIANVATLFLGLTIGTTMSAASFLNWQTILILLLGLLAFVLDTVAGLLFGKLMCVMSRRKINPLIGAAGISAFPMAGRQRQRALLRQPPGECQYHRDG